VCRCDERLNVKTEWSTRLTYTGLRGGLEHLKIETRLINKMFASVMGECVILWGNGGVLFPSFFCQKFKNFPDTPICLLKFQNFPDTPICLSTHNSPVFCKRWRPMEVIEDCTIFFFDILPHTLLPTYKSSSPSSSFPTTKFSHKKNGCTEVFRVEFGYHDLVLELRLSTTIPWTQTQHDSLNSNSTHNKPTLYSI
jgi:hypothetical protein